MMETLEFGKINRTKSYHKGKLVASKIEYSMPIVATDKTAVMREILAAMEIIDRGETHCMTIVVRRDKVGYKGVTRQFAVEDREMGVT